MPKRGWVDGPRDEPSWSWRTVVDSVVPYLVQFFCCFLHSPRRQVWRTVIGTTVRRGSRFKVLQLLESGYWDHFSDLHDEPAGRTVISMTHLHNLRNPTLVRLPPLPSAASLRCHLRTVTSTTDRHKLRRWSLLHFSLKISAFSFRQISCKTKKNLYQN